MNAIDYAWYKEHGFCTRCRKEKAFPGKILCPACLEYNQTKSFNAYDKQKAHEYQSRRREIYHEHKANGICVRCSNPATHGIYCYECSIKQKRKHQADAQKRKNQRHDSKNGRQYRIDNGLCWFCGMPVEAPDLHGKACNSCAERMSHISKLADKSYLKAVINAECIEHKEKAASEGVFSYT